MWCLQIKALQDKTAVPFIVFRKWGVSIREWITSERKTDDSSRYIFLHESKQGSKQVELDTLFTCLSWVFVAVSFPDYPTEMVFVLQQQCFVEPVERKSSPQPHHKTNQTLTIELLLQWELMGLDMLHFRNSFVCSRTKEWVAAPIQTTKNLPKDHLKTVLLKVRKVFLVVDLLWV